MERVKVKQNPHSECDCLGRGGMDCEEGAQGSQAGAGAVGGR